MFDPHEFGCKYLASHRDLDIKVCWQQYRGDNLRRTLEIIRDLGSEIVHAHFQPSNEKGRCRLAEAELDYRQIVRALQTANAQFIPSIEFVVGGFATPEQPFSLERALADAAADARWVGGLLDDGADAVSMAAP